MGIAQSADRMPERINTLVFLDAFMPENAVRSRLRKRPPET
jgi:hypothetical protein